MSGEPDTEQWLTRLSTSQTDGVILVLTELSPAYRARLAAMHMPVVIVDPVGQPDPRIPSIGATNWAGGLMATEHLIEIGHRRIGTITGRPSLLCSQARLDGYRAALERAGIPAGSGPGLLRRLPVRGGAGGSDRHGQARRPADGDLRGQ